jgi:ketosteroid isomerase-like protein
MFNTASRSKPRSPARLPGALRMLVLAAAFSATAAYADDYADVNVLVKSGKLSEALAKAEQYLATKPRDPQMRFIKGVIQTEAGKPGDAIATFNQITQDYPELPEPYNNLAVLYAGQSQYDKARAALEMAIRTNPSYATAHENLGDVYAKLASQAYSKALQLDGGNTAVQPKLALIRTLFNADPKNQKAVSATPPQPTAMTSAPAAARPAVVAAAAPTPAPAAPAAGKTVAAAPAVSVAPKAAVAVAPASLTPKVEAGASSAPAAAVAAAKPAARASAASGSAEKDVEAVVRAWAAAWSGKDMHSYLGSYGKDFATPRGQARKAWEDDRKSRIVGKSRISVKIDNLAVAVKGDKATARFKQIYSADSLNVSSRKTLDLVKTADRWVIVKESTGG